MNREELLQVAEQNFLAWKKTTFLERKHLFENLAKLVQTKKESLAKLISQEMHKPIAQSLAEVEKCAWLCTFYAQNGERFLAPKEIESFAKRSFVTFEPLGVILGIMPWNFPFWQVFRFAVPTIFAGNTVVVKHASNVPKCAEKIEKLFYEAGFEKGNYTNLPIPSNEVKAILENPIIKAVSLTGSELAGKEVASIAGKNLKKCVLELGGNNAFIIFEDADLEKVIPIAVTARMQNNGQSCIAAKRFLIHQSIFESFVEKYKQAILKLKHGNPLDYETQVSDLAREDLAIELEIQVEKSVQMGAKIICGGKRKNSFYEPTILTHITEEMPIFKEETFGPVATIMSFNTIEDAIILSNNSNFGLGVTIFTENVDSIVPYISQFNEGAVFINDMVKSDPRLPFGGIKDSGYGRELAEEGIKEFVNIKTVVINT